MPNEEGFGIQIEVARLGTDNITKQIQDQLNKIKNLSIKIDKVNTDNITKSIQSAVKDGYKGIGDQIPAPKIPPVDTTAFDNLKAKAAEGIKFKINIGDFDVKIKQLEKGFKDTGLSAEETQRKIKNVVSAYERLQHASPEQLIVFEKQLNQELHKTQNELKIAKMDASGFASALQVSNLSNRLQNWLKNNTAATKEARIAVETYVNQIQAANGQLSKGQFREIDIGFKNIDTQMRMQGRLGGSFIDTMSKGAKKFADWTLVSGAVMRAVMSVRNMYKEVVKLDTALVDLRKTTTMTSKELEEFYYTSNNTAKQMGVTTQEIISQAAAWSRLGYSSKESAQQMAKYSSMFSAISPGMNVDTATDGLVSIMKAFDIGNDNPNDVLDGIMSKINVIGNTAATSNAEIVNMLSKSSSAMKEANNTLEQTIALETAAVEITRDDDSVGTAFKTVAMRVRGYDEETGEYIGNVEDLTGKIADLTKTASTPGGISLFTDANKTEYKSTYQLLQEISTVYDQLSDKNQAELLEALAGKRQGQVIAATINNFKAAEKAMDSMANSAGSAEAEMAIIMDSLDYKRNALKETGTGIAQNLFQRDEMKAVIDLLTNLAEVLDFVTDKAGLFGTVGLGLGAILGAKNAGGAKMSAPNNNCFKMPATICVLWDTGVFILSDVKYTLVNK